MSRKVFTAGEVLAAADVNSFLMDQTVMSFAGTAARGSAIPSPVEGMYTHLEDTDDLQFWNGSAWRSPSGLTRLVNQDFTTATSVIVDNVFTSQFDNYKIELRVDAVSSGTTQAVGAQFRKAGSTITASNHYGIGFAADVVGNSSLILSRTSAQANQIVMIAGRTGSSSNLSLDLITPNISTRDTGLRWHAWSTYAAASPASGTSLWSNGSGAYMANDNFDGIIFTPGGGNITGNIKIYGYRN
jgi:hypothetical protein